MADTPRCPKCKAQNKRSKVEVEGRRIVQEATDKPATVTIRYHCSNNHHFSETS